MPGAELGGAVTPAVRPPSLVWSWSDAGFGVLIAVPAAIAVQGDVSRGLAYAIGVIPAAIVGVAPTRRARAATVILGTMAGASILVGATLANDPWIAVPAVFLLALGAVLVARRRPWGRALVVLAVPLVGVGLSYTDLGTAAGLAAVMALGSILAWLVALAWSERAVSEPADAPPPLTVDFGVRLGLAAATAAAIGFALDLDHVGWACATALLVMRPVEQMVELRAVGRLLSVALGATAAGVLATIGLSDTAVSVAALVTVAAAAATHRSRWYVTSAFTTFLVISLMVDADPASAESRWLERVAETALGVGIAYVCGVLLPRVGRPRWAERRVIRRAGPPRRAA